MVRADVKIMGLSDFGVLAQIWAVVRNVKRKSNRIFNSDREKVCTCLDYFDSCGVISRKISYFGEFC